MSDFDELTTQSSPDSGEYSGMTLAEIYVARGKKPPPYVIPKPKRDPKKKWCNRCQEFLPKKEFDFDRLHTGGLDDRCRKCMDEVAAKKAARKLRLEQDAIKRIERHRLRDERKAKYEADRARIDHPDYQRIKAERKTEREKKRRLDNPEKFKAQALARGMREPEIRLIRFARTRAAHYDLPFNIEVSDVVIPETCPVLGIPLVRNFGPGAKSHFNSPTIDRRRPELGYVKGNIEVISWKANSMKGWKAWEDLQKLAQWVLSRE